MAHAGGRPKGHPKSGGRKRGSKNLTPGRHVIGTATLKRELTTLMALDLPAIKLEDMHPLVRDPLQIMVDALSFGRLRRRVAMLPVALAPVHAIPS